MENKLPKLNGLFFSVVQTAIENTAWKRADFDKVAEVEGQLKALSFFYRDYYVAEKIKAEAAKAKLEANPSIMAKPEMVAPVEVDIPAIDIPAIDPLAPPKTVPANPAFEVKPPVEEETPMPDSIAEIVRDRVAAAKKAKPIKKNIKISETALPDVDEYIKNP